MATGLYDKGRTAFGTKLIDWVNDSISAVLVDAGSYTVDLANHQYLSDIPGGAREGTAALANKTCVAGVMDADDTLFTGIVGAQFEALVIYLNTGVDATSRLIAYIDSATGLPFTPSGGNILVQWSSGSNKIFKL